MVRSIGLVRKTWVRVLVCLVSSSFFLGLISLICKIRWCLFTWCLAYLLRILSVLLLLTEFTVSCVRQTCLQASSVPSEKNSDVGKHGMLCEHRREAFHWGWQRKSDPTACEARAWRGAELSCCTGASGNGEERMLGSERLTCISLGTETSQESWRTDYDNRKQRLRL